MEALLLLLLIILLFVILSFRRNMSDRLSVLEAEIRKLRKQLAAPSVPVAGEEAPVTGAAPKAGVAAPVAGEAIPIVGASTPGAGEAIPIVGASTPVAGEAIPIVGASTPVAGEAAPVAGGPVPVSERDMPGVSEGGPGSSTGRLTGSRWTADLEKFVGENLISKIGIAILVLGVAFFVKFAIDNDWIGPAGRVAVGLICGALLAGVAHYLRKGYKAFSSVLIGGALAVFYFTIALAYHEYGLFGQTTSFIIMVVITLFAVALSLLYDRQELAVIALAGGFATPFMASNGSGDYMTLFIYLLILNGGLLLIAYNRGWRLLNLLAFIFTALLFAIWLITLDDAAVAYRNAFIFASLFYLIFFASIIAHTIKMQKKFLAADFGMLLSNTCLYFAAGLFCLTEVYAEEFRGLFCIILGVFNLSATYFLFRKQNTDPNILYLLIGITLTFISLTAPIQLSGNYITLFWASEAVLLYWLFQKSRIPIIRWASAIVWAAMLVSLLMDWVSIYGQGNTRRLLPILINRGFITTLYAALSCLFLFRLPHQETKRFWYVLPGKKLFLITGVLLLYAAGIFELKYQFQQRLSGVPVYLLYTLTYTFAFLLSFTLLAERMKVLAVSRVTKAGLLLFGILVYLLYIPQTVSVQSQLLYKNELRGHFLLHWLSAILVALIIYRAIRILLQTPVAGTATLLRLSPTVISCFFSIVVVIYLTTEVHLIVNALFYSSDRSLARIKESYLRAGWPIIWGICSFGFMWLGMHYKFKPLRVISLTLFTITLLKLFLYDIRNISAGGKIAAFFILGLLLLVVSFMYQRSKK
jgi:uncharacterized membrane protein